MRFEERELPGLYSVIFDTVRDHRGFLAKPFEAGPFESEGFSIGWRQVIHSHTAVKNTLRGLYVQRAPFQEGKLVTSIRGKMYWVVVDVRKDSPTFGRWESTILSGDDGQALWIERGFAHGCLSLSDHVDLLLLADNEHSDEHSVGIAWNDSELGIDWPLSGSAPVISEAHAGNPSFPEFKRRYGGL
ncbi:MAG: dTDP-4-dehydrorhamnose 3,5-epimerase family protein [Rhodothermales bacterium]|nr:dTDP-4-dehydrorhamnose 3,5-epimerase family protein [Rhodothermales bacterium]